MSDVRPFAAGLMAMLEPALLDALVVAENVEPPVEGEPAAADPLDQHELANALGRVVLRLQAARDFLEAAAETPPGTEPGLP